MRRRGAHGCASGTGGGGAVKRSPSTTSTVTLSLPPAALALAISSWTASVGIAGVALHHGQDFRRRDLVAEPVAAQQQRARRIEGNRLHFDEIGVVGRVLFAAHVAEDLVAARMAHGLAFFEFARILALAHRGVVVGDLADGAAANQVEARIAHMADGGGPVFE